MDVEAIIRELTAEIHRLNDLLEAKDSQIAALTEEVRKLTEQIAELTHKKNSSNSSTPPSADHFDKHRRACGARAESRRVVKRDMQVRE